jgi:hypothetical protein
MVIANVTTFWNALITVFLRCLAALGITVPSKVPSRAPVTAAPRPKDAGPGLAEAPSIPRMCEPLPDRLLPPTMKQRIRAESHGASPTVRHPAAAIADAGPAMRTAPEDPAPSAPRYAPALCA